MAEKNKTGARKNRMRAENKMGRVKYDTRVGIACGGRK
jgi:hypothetical protein